MKITFYGGAKTVTGANYILEVAKTKVMIDCGLFQGPPELVELNSDDFAFNPKSISHLFITHSHQDHCGRIPKLVADGFNGKIICTKPSLEMIELSLDDAASIQMRESSETGFPPIFTKKDVEKSMKLFEGVDYGTTIKISDNLSVKIWNAGHILGSAMYQFTATEGKKKRVITFTGDLGNQPAPLLPKHDVINKTDYLIIESAYGNRNHEKSTERKELLTRIIKDTIWNKGVLLIPSFAIERTQILLYEINEMVEKKVIPPVPIFVDSPLAIKMTQVYKKYSHHFNFETKQIIKRGDDIFNFPGLKFTPSKEESKTINHIKAPKIIIAGSGMSTGGRMLYHEKLYLPFRNTTMLFVGYQVDGTIGRQIFEGSPIVKILGENVKIRARVRGIGGYSAHADQKQLLNFIDEIPSKIKRVFVVQGEREASFTLKRAIESKLKIKAEVPKFEEIIELD